MQNHKTSLIYFTLINYLSNFPQHRMRAREQRKDNDGNPKKRRCVCVSCLSQRKYSCWNVQKENTFQNMDLHWYETWNNGVMDVQQQQHQHQKQKQQNVCYLRNGILLCGFFPFRNKWSEKKIFRSISPMKCCVCSRHLLKYGTTSEH